MALPNWIKELLPQSWEWFTTPSGSEPPSDNSLIKFIRYCQRPIIAHPLGALVLFVFFQWLLEYGTRRTFWWSVFFMGWWQWNVWEKLDSVSYPPREVIWRMILGILTLSLLLLIF